MKTAEIFSVTSRLPHGYGWKWRCHATKTESSETFGLFYECVQDARKHGYEVDLGRAQDDPAGAAPLDTPG